MKKLIYIALLLVSSIIYSQNQKLQDIIINNSLKLHEVENFLKINNIVLEEIECQDIPNPNIQINKSAYSTTVKENFVEDEKYVFNIYFHVIYNDDHTRPINISENEILFVVSSLNISYNRFNIYFKYKGFDDIDNSDYMTIYLNDTVDENHNTMDELREYSRLPEVDVYDENAINIFITDEILRENGSALNGLAFRPGTIAVFRDEAFFNTTVLHELGHCFDLLHLSKNFDNDECEHVTRDENDSNYNADTNGDEVTDTEATFKFGPSDLTGCDFLDLFEDKFDCEGNPYRVEDDLGNVILNIPVSNYMSAVFNTCRSQFSNGQGVRMRETIVNQINGIYQEEKTEVEFLYEPYKITTGEYTNSYFYQPGFDYDFVLCHQNGAWGGYSEPSDYNDISFIYDNDGYLNYSFDFNHSQFNEIFQRDHTAVRIIQLDDEQPRKCYSTLLKTAIGGSVTKFVDDIPSTNVVITQKDSLSINSPDLINNLQSGLYNIKKNYNDGSTDENLIYKNNN